MAEIRMSEHEAAIVAKHGFKVSASGDRFVVIDPMMPKRKNKYEGGNLWIVLYQALDERKRVKIEDLNVIEYDFEPIPVTIEAVVTLKAIKHGKLFIIKSMILDNPKVTVDEIVNKLKEEGMSATLSTVVSARSDFLGTIKLLKKAGRLKEN